MVESVTLSDFQAHEKRRIDFGDGVTTIVGPSDVGKSAIIRALRWVCQNTPQGTAFVRDGAEGAIARAVVDGHAITRSRLLNGENTYMLDGREFKAFGHTVPDPIADVLKVGDINFQGQHDASFWLSASAGEVSRQLNAIVDLSIIDAALEEVNRRFRAADSLATVRATIAKTAKANRVALEWATDADAELKRVEELDRESIRLGDDRSRLHLISLSISETVEKKRLAQEKLDGITRVGKACAVMLRLKSQRDELAAAVVYGAHRQRIVDDGAPDISQLSAAKEYGMQAKVTGIGLRQLLLEIRTRSRTIDAGAPDIRKLVTAYSDYERIMSDRDDLARRLRRIDTAKELVMSKAVSCETAAYELREATQGMCPVCGKPLE